jgi:iron complex outermembrane receptor protein
MAQDPNGAGIAGSEGDRVSADSTAAATDEIGSVPVVTAGEVKVIGRRWQDYTVPKSTTATKMDTPIIETPVSVQVVPHAVLQDQQVVRIDKALENVSGVINPPSGIEGDFEQFRIRGFTADIL